MIDNLIRPHLRRFSPYSSARSIAREGNIFLDANESAFGNPADLDGAELNRYPDPLQIELRTALAKRHSVSTDNVFLGAGSDEVIDLLIRLFCEPPNDSIIILEPTYGVYRIAADLNNIRVLSVALDSAFQIDRSSVRQAIRSDTKIIFCCSPNNPTGNLLRREDMLALCDSFSGIVIVDEAYGDFADENESMIPDVARHENLIILKTLSKAWGMAGARVGYCVANPLIVSYLLRIKAPYNMDALKSRAALAALENEDFLRNSVRSVLEERAKVCDTLRASPPVIKVYPSNANFLLVAFSNAERVYELLAAKGIIVRRRTEPRLRNCLRITIGAREENDALLHALEEIS